jgi:hypothetical protein
MTTSYFSSVPFGSNFGVRRGIGGANEGRTRESREELEYSVKTGMSEGGEGTSSEKRADRKVTQRSRPLSVLL